MTQSSTDAASPPEAPRSGLWSPGAVVIGTADYGRDADCQFSGIRHATWPFRGAVVYYSSGCGKSLAYLAVIRQICADAPLVVTEGPQEAARLLEARRRLLARHNRGARNAIAHGRPADVTEAFAGCLACEQERGKLLEQLLRGHGGYVNPVLNAEILAELMDDREYAAPGSAVAQVGRRRASRTVAGHVMIPYAAVRVLVPGMTVDAALGQVLRSGEPALPVGEGSEVAGVVTLADLARTVHNSRGVPSIQRVEVLMRAPAEVTIDTPLPEVRAAMSRDDAGLVVVRGPDGGVVGYITASSLLGNAGPGDDDASRGDPRMEVPLLGAAGGTVRVCVSS